MPAGGSRPLHHKRTLGVRRTQQAKGCDVVSLMVEDIAPHGYAVDRATVRQRKTRRPVKFEITEQSRLAVDEYLDVHRKKPIDQCPRLV